MLIPDTALFHNTLIHCAIGGLMAGLSAYRIFAQVFLNAGQIVVTKSGIKVNLLWSSPTLYDWEDIQEISDRSSGRGFSYTNLQLNSGKDIALGFGMFPLNTQDLTDYLRTQREHFLFNKPPIELSYYKHQNYWLNPIVITSLLCSPLLLDFIATALSKRH